MSEKERLYASFKECDIHIERIEASIDIITKMMPIKKEVYENLDDESVKTIDQFIYRYTLLQDKIGGSILKNMVSLLEYSDDARTFIDILNILEKNNIIQSARKWRDLRDLRNRLSHEYTDNIDAQVNTLNEVYKSYFYLKDEYTNIKNFLKDE